MRALAEELRADGANSIIMVIDLSKVGAAASLAQDIKARGLSIDPPDTRFDFKPVLDDVELDGDRGANTCFATGKATFARPPISKMAVGSFTFSLRQQWTGAYPRYGFDSRAARRD
jgi:hypothetical protein